MGKLAARSRAQLRGKQSSRTKPARDACVPTLVSSTELDQLDDDCPAFYDSDDEDVAHVFPTIVKPNVSKRPVDLFPNLTHTKGKTRYTIRTVSGQTTFELPAPVVKVKEEDIGLANRWKTLNLPKPKRCKSKQCCGSCGLKKRKSKTRKRERHALEHVLETSAPVPKRPTTHRKSAPGVHDNRMASTDIRASQCGEPSFPAKQPSSSQDSLPPQPSYQYLASMPKVNVWNSGSTVSAPMVNVATEAPAFSRPEDCCPTHLQPFGGLRLLEPTMKRLTYTMDLGTKIRKAMHGVFDEHPTLTSDVLAHIGRPDCTAIDAHLVNLVKPYISQILYQEFPSYKPPPPTECCVVDAHMLDHWQKAAKDPDTEAAQWLLHGAPAGITEAVKDCGIFPLYDPTKDTAEVDASDLHTQADFANYSGVESDVDVAKEVERIIDQKHVLRFKSVKDATRYLKAKPVLSKIGAIKKVRNGKLKCRMVIDSKQSGISKATRKHERTLLPRALDVVQDGLSLLGIGPDMTLEFLVADFRDAFFIVPNKRSERRFFAVSYKGEILVFLKTTQGSRGAPLTWARIIALVMRLTQSVVGHETCRISTYVDDPLTVATGTEAQRHRTFATILLIWSCLQLPLAMDKATLGVKTTWTSAVFQTTHDGLLVRIKDALVTETMDLLTTFMKANIVRRKELRSCIGKVMHIASLIPTVRPFVSQMYGALYSVSNGPAGDTIWTKQIEHSLTWLIAFLSEAEGKLERNFDLRTFQGHGKEVAICLDASPWGLGGYLVEDHRIQSWFACDLGAAEQTILQISLAESAAQQVVEALVVLVALRAWKKRWLHQRVILRVKSDNISALVMCLKLKTSGHGTGIIARELALDIACSEYRPQIAEHVPGVDNVIADALSRRFQPGAQVQLPRCLSNVQELVLPARGAEYFRTLGSKPPAVTKRQGGVGANRAVHQKTAAT